MVVVVAVNGAGVIFLCIRVCLESVICCQISLMVVITFMQQQITYTQEIIVITGRTGLISLFDVFFLCFALIAVVCRRLLCY